MRTISITEALNELKLYDTKIHKAIANSKFADAARKSSDKVGTVSREEFNKKAKASYQSAKDLITNRNELKSAIVKSNAETIITVNGQVMTRAEGIERKISIQYEEELLDEMKRQYADATAAVNKENKKVDNKIYELISALVGRESSKQLSKEDQEAVEKPYRTKNEFELIDPLVLYDKITELEAEIDGFRSNIDSQLVLSNSTSFIDISF
ncbi:MAG: hypothetical protein HFH68_00275 [Lachnospiraceae bacterium]|nr:hypothetical protein [Lachnospiraceae bacterium]